MVSRLNRRRATQVSALVVLTIATIATFRPVVSNQFFGVDDAAFIEENAISYSLDTRSSLEAWTRSTLGLYIPIPNLIWSGISEFSKSDTKDPPKLGHARYPNQRLNPYAFHLVSLVCHIATGLLVYCCLVWLGVGLWGAFFGAGLFLLHPVQVESVAWASLLKDVVSTAFGLASVVVYLIYVDTKTTAFARLLYAFSFTLYLMALCSKPGAVMLPYIIGLIGFVCLKRPAGVLLRELIPWALCSIPIVIVTMRVQMVDVAVQFEILEYHLRPLVALDALSFYLVKLVAPMQLAFDYGHSPSRALSSAWIYVSWIPPLGLAIFVYLKRSQYPNFVVAYGIFILGLLPTLGLKPYSFQAFSTVTDHYLSLSMFGVAISVGSLFPHLVTRQKSTILTLVVGFSMLGLLSVKSHAQLAHWTDSHAVYRQAISVNPDSWFSYRMLGLEQELNHQPDRALEYYRESMSINGNTYGHSGLFTRLNDAEDFERAYEVISDVIDLHHRDIDYLTRANISYELGRFEDAIRDLDQANRLNPSPEMTERIARSLKNIRSWTRPSPPSVRRRKD